MKRDILRLSVLLAFVIAGFSACQDEMGEPLNDLNMDEVGDYVAFVAPNDGEASTPISDGGITPYIIPGDGPGSSGGNRDCNDVVAAWGLDEDYFGYSFGQIDFEDGQFQFAEGEDWPDGLTVNVSDDGIFVEFSLTEPFKIDNVCYLVGAVIVKGSDDANVYFYPEGIAEDGGLASPINPGGQRAALSNLTFCFIEVECEEECEWIGETAWAANGDDPGSLRYVNRGNWATYVEYEAGKTVTLFAGQTMDAGTVNFSAAVDGEVTITITLNPGWRFFDDEDEENVKIQDYAVAPTENPAPGLFDHKGYATEIVVPLNEFYGVHVDVEWGYCPED